MLWDVLVSFGCPLGDIGLIGGCFLPCQDMFAVGGGRMEEENECVLLWKPKEMCWSSSCGLVDLGGLVVVVVSRGGRSVDRMILLTTRF